MKIFANNIELPIMEEQGIRIVNSTLRESTCYGFDLVLIDPINTASLTGLADTSTGIGKWRQDLVEWVSSGGIIITILRPRWGANYGWVPIAEFPPREIEGVGSINDYIGIPTNENHAVQRFLEDNEFRVPANLILQGDGIEKDIKIFSRINKQKVTSFGINLGSGKIIFVPPLANASFNENLVNLGINLLKANSGLTVRQKEEINSAIDQINAEIEPLKEKKHGLEEQLTGVEQKLEKLFTDDPYLSSAKEYFDSVMAQNPDPRMFYSMEEKIEKAFSGEHEMRSQLSVAKGKIDNLTKRINVFRHEQQAGKEPTPLTEDEIKEFRSTVKEVLEKYTQYLYDQR